MVFCLTKNQLQFKKMSTQLQQFLDQNRQRDSSSFNLVGMGDYRGKYMISNQFFQTFFTVYDYALNHSVVPSLAEVPYGESIIRLDVDNKGDCYTDDQLLDFSSRVNSLLEKFSQEKLLCCLFEKPQKKGVHLMWPQVGLGKNDLINFSRDAQKFVTFGHVDETVPYVSWLLYGSAKAPTTNNPNPNPYTFTRAIYDNQFVDTNYQNILAKLELRDPAVNIPMAGNSLTKIFSIRPLYRPILKYVSIEPSPQASQPREIVYDYSQRNHNDGDVAEFLNLLNPQRAHDYLEWIKVGRCIYNCTNGEGFQLWDDWSSQATNYDYSVLMKKWLTFQVNENWGIALLKSWARSDNPEEYVNLTRRLWAKSNPFVIKKRFAPGELATLFKQIVGDYVYAFEKNHWYMFDNHHWNNIERIDIQIAIEQTLKPLFDQINITGSGDPKEEERNKALVAKVLSDLGEPARLSAIVDMVCMRYYHKGLERKMDSDMSRICFQNGVYDFKNLQFRDGQYTDYISRQLRWSYREPSVEEIQLVEKTMTQYFPDPNTRHYMLTILSRIFMGNTEKKSIHFWIGQGDNGKTTFELLLEEMVGSNFCCKLKSSLFTTDENSPNGAQPELAKLSGKILAFVNEPEQSVPLKSQLLKILSGADTIQPRELYQKGSTVEPIQIKAQLVIVGNSEPKLRNSGDSALYNRFEIVEFVSSFVDPELAPATWEEQLKARTFPKDPKFVSETIGRLVEPLTYYLIQWYKKTKSDQLVRSEQIRKATKDYREKGNHILKFFESYVVFGQLGEMPIDVLFSCFKTYLTNNYYPPPFISQEAFIHYINVNYPDRIHDGNIVGVSCLNAPNPMRI